MGWMVNVTLRPVYTRKRPGTLCVGWAPRSVWTGADNIAPTGIRSPNLSPRSVTLYRLRYSCSPAARIVPSVLSTPYLIRFSDKPVVWNPVTLNVDTILKYIKNKAIPLQALTGPEGSRRLRFLGFKTIDTWRWHRPPLPQGNIPGTHFC
jgi:hypothetical protein